MKVIQCTQGTPEWLKARCGVVTGSRIRDALSFTHKGEAAGRVNYRAEKVCEILTGEPYPNGYVNDEMIWGTNHEADARAVYSRFKRLQVDQVGFALHPVLERAGASPDGLIGNDGMVEIKCPKTATHLSYLLDKMVPAAYRPQMQWNMACCEREWSDFISYDPRLKGYELFICRLYRDGKKIREMEKGVVEFNHDVDLMLARLRHLTEEPDWIDQLGE